MSQCDSDAGAHHYESVTSEFITKLHQQKQQLSNTPITSAATPPNQRLLANVPFSATNSPFLDPPPCPPRDWTKPRSATFTIQETTSNNPYDHVTVMGAQSEASNDAHIYLGITPKNLPDGDMNTQLQTLAKTQNVLCSEFHELKRDVMTEMLLLKKMNENLMNLVQGSLSTLQTTIERNHFQFLESTDHLGKQILDFRRDIVAVARKQPTMLGSSNSMFFHCFEWEVANLDSLVKTQKESSSQFYQIHQIDCKFHGRATCTKDDRLRLKIFGECPQSSKNPLQKSTKFECTVHMLDKTEKHPDLLMGKVVGDFTSGNEWVIGDASTSDIKKKGYVTRAGNVNLKFIIEMN